MNPMRHDRFTPDCNYNLDFDIAVTRNIRPHDHTDHHVEGQLHSNYFAFIIRKSTCKSDDKVLSQTMFRGGSSFFIIASNYFHQVVCQVRDNFDDSYFVYCPLSTTPSATNPKHASRSANNLPCAHLIVILDYEHFDAFNEMYAHMPPMEYRVFDDKSLCLNHSVLNSTRFDNDQSTHSRTGSTNLPSSSWIRRLPHSLEGVHDLSLNHNSTLANLSESLFASLGLGEYSWTGSGNTYPTAEAFNSLFMNTSFHVSAFQNRIHNLV
jgi:hypothetical protein